MKELRQPKAGDIWLRDEGAVLVFGVSDTWVDYLWQHKSSAFKRASRHQRLEQFP